jgi:hypothetical protein
VLSSSTRLVAWPIGSVGGGRRPRLDRGRLGPHAVNSAERSVVTEAADTRHPGVRPVGGALMVASIPAIAVTRFPTVGVDAVAGEGVPPGDMVNAFSETWLTDLGGSSSAANCSRLGCSGNPWLIPLR